MYGFDPDVISAHVPQETGMKNRRFKQGETDLHRFVHGLYLVVRRLVFSAVSFCLSR